MSQRIVKSDKLIVIDLETTCTNENAEQFSNEIIEIGMSIIDIPKLVVVENVSLLIKPQRSKITDFCTKLTGITEKDVEDGLSLQEASAILIKDFKTLDYAWASWGDFDRYIMNRECTHYKCRIPMNRQHLNLKALYAVSNNLPELIGLGSAVKRAKMSFIGEHHRGVDDARTTAQLFINMQIANRIDHVR